jgi:hypothetical protein
LLVIVGPIAGNSFELRVELDSCRAVKVQIALNAGLVSGGGKHGERHGNGNVDPDLAASNFGGKFAGGGAGLRRERAAVAVWIRVDNVHGILQ